jgi:mannose-6-phosphate isomerase-like protein (cupin superfamily)
MLKIFPTSATVLLGLAIVLPAQTPAKLPPSGKAVDITSEEMQAFLKAHPYGDNMMRMIDVGALNAGVSLLRYQKTTTPRTSAIIHSDVPEVYYVISGEATFVTGGVMENVKDMPASNPAVKELSGPTWTGVVKDGVSRHVGPGDVMIIPAWTPHFASDVKSDIVFLVVRMDPKKLVQLKEQ